MQYLGPAREQPFVIMHHVSQVLPVQPGLLLIQPPYLFITLSSSHHSIIQPRVEPSSILLHSLSKLSKRLPYQLELPLVMILTLGGLVRGQLGHVFHSHIELAGELGENLNFTVTKCKRRCISKCERVLKLTQINSNMCYRNLRKRETDKMHRPNILSNRNNYVDVARFDAWQLRYEYF